MEFNLHSPELLTYFSSKQLGQLTDITLGLIDNLGNKVGKYADVQLGDKYTASHFKRYTLLKKLLNPTNGLPMNPHPVFGSGMSMADFSCGDGKAIHGLLKSMIWSGEFQQGGLSMKLFDIQMDAIQPSLEVQMGSFNGFNANFEYSNRDITTPPDPNVQKFDLGIIGFTHFYLTPEDFAYAIAARMSECRVLVVTPATIEHSEGMEIDGLIIYRDGEENICGHYEIAGI